MLINELVGAVTPYHMNMPVDVATRPLLEWGSTKGGKVKFAAVKMHDGLFHLMVYKYDDTHSGPLSFITPCLGSLSVVVNKIDSYKVYYITRKMFLNLMAKGVDQHWDFPAVQAIRARTAEVNTFDNELVKASQEASERAYSSYRHGDTNMLYDYNLKLLHKSIETHTSEDLMHTVDRFAVAISPDPEFIPYRMNMITDQQLDQKSYLSPEICRLVQTRDQTIHFDKSRLWSIFSGHLDLELDRTRGTSQCRLGDMQTYLIEQLWPHIVSTRKLELIVIPTNAYYGYVHIASTYLNGNTVFSTLHPDTGRQLSGNLSGCDGNRVIEALRAAKPGQYKIYNGMEKEALLEKLTFNVTLKQI